MTDVIIEAVTWVLRAAFVLSLASLLLLPVVVGFFRSAARHNQRRQAESEAARWARLHGGDPEYGGGVGRKARLEVVQSGGEMRARLIDASVERA